MIITHQQVHIKCVGLIIKPKLTKLLQDLNLQFSVLYWGSNFGSNYNSDSGNQYEIDNK